MLEHCDSFKAQKTRKEIELVQDTNAANVLNWKLPFPPPIVHLELRETGKGNGIGEHRWPLGL